MPGGRNLDFSNPLQARKWLSLLCNDGASGIRIRPNLDVPKRFLGFSFKSNDWGLHGPASNDANAVVVGTSFAMGFAVDEGNNWYERLLDPERWTNCGLPVGPEQWRKIIECHCPGARQLALFIYHPNVWQHALMYQRWQSSGQSAFDFFKWKTKFIECAMLSIRKSRDAKRKRSIVTIRDEGELYRLNGRYCYLTEEDLTKAIDRTGEALLDVFFRFDKAICVRVPIKEELKIPHGYEDVFHSLNHSIDEAWHATKSLLSAHPNIVFSEAKGFRLTHFHSHDNHLNESGNAYLRSVLRELLSNEGQSCLLAG